MSTYEVVFLSTFVSVLLNFLTKRKIVEETEKRVNQEWYSLIRLVKAESESRKMNNHFSQAVKMGENEKVAKTAQKGHFDPEKVEK